MRQGCDTVLLLCLVLFVLFVICGCCGKVWG